MDYSSVSKKIFSGGTPSTSREDYWGGENKWLSSGETRNRFIYDTEKKITEKGIVESSTRLAEKGDTVIASAGQGKTRGQVAFLEVDTYINQSIIAIKPNTNIVDPLWIFYDLSNRYDELRQISDTSSIRGSLATVDFKSMKLSVPPIEKQRIITAILRNLDEKIELNRQTNATLEAIAQAIFKQWFVDFNYPGATGDLVDSELGPIPPEWRVGKLGEICEFVYGKALKAEIRKNGIHPVVGSSGIVDYNDRFLVEGPGIVIGRKGTIGKVSWIPQNFYPIDTTFYINDLLGSEFLYFHNFLLRNQDFQKIGSDSAVPGLNRNLAYDIPIVIPKISVVLEYNLLIKSTFDKIYSNEQQISTLAQIRDALLPKLMSGQIQV